MILLPTLISFPIAFTPLTPNPYKKLFCLIIYFQFLISNYLRYYAYYCLAYSVLSSFIFIVIFREHFICMLLTVAKLTLQQLYFTVYFPTKKKKNLKLSSALSMNFLKLFKDLVSI